MSEQHNHAHASSCSCGHAHHEHHAGCGCGHAHHEEPCCAHEHCCTEDHEDTGDPSHSHGHCHTHEHGCSCAACDAAEGEEKKAGPKEILLVGGAVLLVAASFLLPEGLWRTVLLAAAALLVGWEMFIEGIKGLFRLSLDEMTLMTIAVVAAFAIGEGFEGAMVTILFHIGEFIENRAVLQGRKRIDALLSIVPETANRLGPDGAVQTVPSKEVAVGEPLLIRAGERVPLDCEVLSGESELDTSAVTGESQPQPAAAGSMLLSGMVNLSGALQCRVTRDYHNSTASKIAQMVREATEKKSKTEKFITRFSRVYTPVVVLLAVLLAVLPPLLGAGAFSVWLSRALIFLVASCPCALVISIPITFYNIIGAASRNGALIKGSQHIETLSKIRQVVFDKTGTLTTGQLSVAGVTPAAGISAEQVLRLAAICESASVHPIAQAVREKAGSVPAPQSAEDIPGKGVRAVIDGKAYYCGSARLMEENGLSTASLPAASLYLADEERVLGAITAGDTIRPEAKDALLALQKQGVSRTVMLSGDRRDAAERVQKQLGITEVRAELLPQDKVTAMESLRRNGVTAFVGDGINDGPVLAAADIGFAMGMGSDLAAQAADVVLMGDNLGSIARTIALARRGLTIARQNLVFILAVKLIVLVLGALGYAPMWAAVFADVGVCVLTVLNSLRAGAIRK